MCIEIKGDRQNNPKKEAYRDDIKSKVDKIEMGCNT